jgi:hypothetical protein
MNSLIENYALEMKDSNGAPTGHFFFDKDAAKAVSTEVVNTHMQFKNKGEAATFLDSRFNDTFDHFDVNKDKLIEVERMPQFLRYLIGNSLEINLQ